MRRLGADVVVDYSKEDFAEILSGYANAPALALYAALRIRRIRSDLWLKRIPEQVGRAGGRRSWHEAS